MSSNVGLSTPRGSGTSGYVQRSLSHLKPRDVPGSGPPSSTLGPSRTPDASILRHTRLRAIEAQVFALRDQLEEAETDEDEIDAQCEALRAKLTAEMERNGDSGAGGKLKAHQSHDIAAAKIKEDERLRRALGIRRDYEEGGHWKRREEKERMAQNGGGEAERGVARDAREGERKSSLRKEVERSRSRSPRREARERSLPRHRDWDRPAQQGGARRRERSESRSRSPRRSISRSRSRSRSASYSD